MRVDTFKFGLFLMAFMLIPSLGHFRTYAVEIAEEIKERDYSLRSIGRLQITNARGDITVQGWPLDKIRIKFSKSAMGDTQADAKAKLKWLDYEYKSQNDQIEISSIFSDELKLKDRLQEKTQPVVRLHLTVTAPSYLNLQLWATSGSAQLKNWKQSTSIRTNGGAISVEGVKMDKLDLLCAECAMKIHDAQAALTCKNSSGSVFLEQVKGKTIFVESENAALQMREIEGEQTYISSSGTMDGQTLTGQIAFQMRDGIVRMRDISGPLTGMIESGEFLATFLRWRESLPSSIEAGSAKILLRMPADFTGEYELSSSRGKIESEFPRESEGMGLKRIASRFKSGTRSLKATSEGGAISLLKRF